MKNDFSPLVSIVIPVYNGAAFLAQAVDSALLQTYPNREIIVWNDGSKDGGETERIALSYGDRIRYFHHENCGVAETLNAAIRKAKGDYVSWLSHDDLYLPEKLQVQIDYLRTLADPEVILYSDFEWMNEAGLTFETKRLAHYAPEQFRAAFVREQLISGCSLLIPIVCFHTVGFFEKQYKTTQDYVLWFEFSKKYAFHHVPGVVIRSRIHPGQDTRRLADHVVRENNELYLRFLASLRPEEILALGDVSVPAYYMGLGRFLSSMGYEAAAARARSLALGSAISLSPRDVISFCRNLAYTMAAPAYRRFRRVFAAA